MPLTPKTLSKRSWLLLPAVALLGLYLAVPAALLRWSLDLLIFMSATQDATHEAQRFELDVGSGATILVRRYGHGDGACAYFFPGQRGGMGVYEETLFPFLQQSGVTIYAVSYPGQDGASGQSRLATLSAQVKTAMELIAQRTSCEPSASVFLGRSLGATVALSQAVQWQPKGVIVDGLGADLSIVVRAWIDRHPLLSGWQLLPIEQILGQRSYAVGPMLDKLSSTAITVFQGTADTVTPFAAAQAVSRKHPNITFRPVPGGKHDNTYVLARPDYLEALHMVQPAAHQANPGR